MDRTLDYVKDRYNEEQARFKHVEDKCSKLLTFLTVVISALVAIASVKNSQLFSPSNPWEWIRVILYLLSGFCAACAWGHALMALKIGHCPSAPVNEGAAKYIRDSDESERDSFIFECYVNTTQKLTAQINDKIKPLEHSYAELTYSAWGIGIISLLSIILEFTK